MMSFVGGKRDCGRIVGALILVFIIFSCLLGSADVYVRGFISFVCGWAERSVV